MHFSSQPPRLLPPSARNNIYTKKTNNRPERSSQNYRKYSMAFLFNQKFGKILNTETAYHVQPHNNLYVQVGSKGEYLPFHLIKNLTATHTTRGTTRHGPKLRTYYKHQSTERNLPARLYQLRNDAITSELISKPYFIEYSLSVER